jgi:hypothetical protein
METFCNMNGDIRSPETALWSAVCLLAIDDLISFTKKWDICGTTKARDADKALNFIKDGRMLHVMSACGIADEIDSPFLDKIIEEYKEAKTKYAMRMAKLKRLNRDKLDSKKQARPKKPAGLHGNSGATRKRRKAVADNSGKIRPQKKRPAKQAVPDLVKDNCEL